MKIWSWLLGEPACVALRQAAMLIFAIVLGVHAPVARASEAVDRSLQPRIERRLRRLKARYEQRRSRRRRSAPRNYSTPPLPAQAPARPDAPRGELRRRRRGGRR